jgi:RNA polymerase sigma-70 factor (ECF subfamily)
MNPSNDDPWRTHRSLLMRLGEPADERAWEEFHERYAPMIRGWCRHWFPREADDMVQEVFVRLIRCLKDFEYQPGRGRFRGYLKTVTHRLMSDLSERPAPAAGIADEEVLGEVEARQDLQDRLGALFDLELLDQAKERVRERVEESTWSAYERTAEQGRRPAEVACELGMKVGAVYQARHSVIGQLRREIEILQDHP